MKNGKLKYIFIFTLKYCLFFISVVHYNTVYQWCGQIHSGLKGYNKTRAPPWSSVAEDKSKVLYHLELGYW